MQTNTERRMAAAKRGSKFYEPKDACPKCGDPSRYVLSNQCVTCSKKRARKSTAELRKALQEARGE